MELQTSHIYLVKNLPVKRSYSLFSDMGNKNHVDKEKEIEKVEVKEITKTCYLLVFIGSTTPFYVEQSDSDIIYLEDLGIIAK